MGEIFGTNQGQYPRRDFHSEALFSPLILRSFAFAYYSVGAVPPPAPLAGFLAFFIAARF